MQFRIPESRDRGRQPFGLLSPVPPLAAARRGKVRDLLCSGQQLNAPGVTVIRQTRLRRPGTDGQPSPSGKARLCKTSARHSRTFAAIRSRAGEPPKVELLAPLAFLGLGPSRSALRRVARGENGQTHGHYR